MKIDNAFTATITKDKTSNWTCVEWPESVEALGTGMAVKVSATLEGHEFKATFLPIGGMHILPLRAAILKATNKKLGDEVIIQLVERQ